MKKLFKNPFVWGAIIGCALLTIYPFLARSHMGAPPPLLSVGPWSLIDQNEKPFGSADLKGKVVVADFIFTTCPSLCPLLTTRMIDLHRHFDKMGDKVHFISVSVDPEIDTPEVLRQYMKKYQIAAGNWSFLTGDKKAVHQLVVEQLKLHVGEKENDDINHVAHFILLDQNGDLRGLFPTDPTGLAALERAAKYLAK